MWPHLATEGAAHGQLAALRALLLESYAGSGRSKGWQGGSRPTNPTCHTQSGDPRPDTAAAAAIACHAELAAGRHPRSKLGTQSRPLTLAPAPSEERAQLSVLRLAPALAGQQAPPAAAEGQVTWTLPTRAAAEARVVKRKGPERSRRSVPRARSLHGVRPHTGGSLGFSATFSSALSPLAVLRRQQLPSEELG